MILIAVLVSNVLTAGADQSTYADLAVLVAKGYFGNYVKPDASFEECVGFLQGQGIYFSLFDLIDTSKPVSKEDFARVIGQSTLLFAGKAEIVNGRIKKPLGAETWVDYCLLNDIDLAPIWNRFVHRAD